MRHEADPVAWADSGREDALGKRAYLVAELCRGHVGPGVLGLAPAHDDRLRRLGGAFEDNVGERGRG